MTWPSVSQGDVWNGVRTSYQLSAQAVDGVFLPAGEAWHIALAAHPGLPLYDTDNFHPSPMGSFLAALEIYERLSGRDARTFPAVAFNLGQPMTMSADTVRMLQQAAHQANGAYAASPRVTAVPPAPSVRSSNGC
jgi:TPR repeat protein